MAINIDASKISLRLTYPGDGYATVERKCSECHGNGFVNDTPGMVGPESTCPTCHGSGTVKVKCRVDYDMLEWCSEYPLAGASEFVEGILTRFENGEDVAGVEIRGEDDE